jgi:hypothetical protein
LLNTAAFNGFDPAFVSETVPDEHVDLKVVIHVGLQLRFPADPALFR